MVNRAGFVTPADSIKKTCDWVIEGLTTISRHSVIGANKYKTDDKPQETFGEVMDGRKPKLLMDIHNVSGVNEENRDLSKLNRPANSSDFND